MYDVYFIFRSVTHGQAGRAALQRGRISARLIRSPGALSPEGCAYALVVRDRDRDRAAQLLRQADSRVLSVYRRAADGSFERLAL